MAMTSRQEKFISEYMIDYNATRAAKVAGYSVKTAYSIGHENLKKPVIREEIDKCISIVLSKNEMRVEDILLRTVQLLRADARDLVELRRIACRYCHGDGFLYQRTPQEFLEAHRSHLKSEDRQTGPSFNEQGGNGYSEKYDPHADCPECFGDGVCKIFIHDTRTLSSDSAALYARVKETSAGIQLIMLSKFKAIEWAARYFGMDKYTA